MLIESVLFYRTNVFLGTANGLKGLFDHLEVQSSSNTISYFIKNLIIVCF